MVESSSSSHPVELTEIGYQQGIPNKSMRFARADGDTQDPREIPDPVIPTRRMPRDENGLVVGRWRTDVMEVEHGCPNCVFSHFLPCVSLAQIGSRMGFYRYCVVFLLALVVYSGYCITLYISYKDRTKVTQKDLLQKLRPTILDYLDLNLDVYFFFCSMSFYILIIYILMTFRRKIRRALEIPGSAVEDCIVTCSCAPCSIAQMATQTSSYDPHGCRFTALSTLPGYNAARTDRTQLTEPRAAAPETESTEDSHERDERTPSFAEEGTFSNVLNV